MNSNLLFDFTVDKEKKSIYVKREFAANLGLVWDAWTKPEHLDQWWAPKPYRTQTKSMDFRAGGRWLYAMIAPDGVTQWCLLDYQTIQTQKSYSAMDAFCDENGTVAEAFPGSLWTNTFSENAGHTTVNIVIVYKNPEDIEKIIELGFKEGFTMALGNLDQYLEAKGQLAY